MGCTRWEETAIETEL